MKRFRLIKMKKKVSKEPSIDFVLWFILTKHILINHHKFRKEKKMYGSSIKQEPGSRMELNSVFKG